MTLSNTPIAPTDFSRFLHDYIKHTHHLDWLHQAFQWLYQTYPSPRLPSPGFSMTMSSTHLLNWLQQVFPWLCQVHTSSTDFSRSTKRCVLEIVMEKPAEVSQDDGCVLYSHAKTCWSQSRPWLCLTVIAKPAEVSLDDGCFRFFMTIPNKPIASTDFSRFFHDYIKHSWSQSRWWVCLI
jgi:hypothetical protein